MENVLFTDGICSQLLRTVLGTVNTTSHICIVSDVASDNSSWTVVWEADTTPEVKQTHC